MDFRSFSKEAIRILLTLELLGSATDLGLHILDFWLNIANISFS